MATQNIFLFNIFYRLFQVLTNCRSFILVDEKDTDLIIIIIIIHIISCLDLNLLCSPSIVFIISFATLFFMVISVAKDLTDIEGDMK